MTYSENLVYQLEHYAARGAVLVLTMHPRLNLLNSLMRHICHKFMADRQLPTSHVMVRVLASFSSDPFGWDMWGYLRTKDRRYSAVSGCDIGLQLTIAVMRTVRCNVYFACHFAIIKDDDGPIIASAIQRPKSRWFC